MWRKLNREDLVSSNPLLVDEEPHRPFYWRVYEDYEILPSEDRDFDYLQAARRKGSQEPECVKVYRPLIDTPYLFLEFARIWEQKDRVEALMDWVRRYGLLGFTQRNPQYCEERSPLRKFIDSVEPTRRYDDRGGSGDAFDLIFAEADQTNQALTLYEAALSRDVEKLEQGLFWDEESEFDEDRWRLLQEKVRATGENWTDILVDSALSQVLEFTVPEVHAYAYPDIAFPCRTSGDRTDPLLTVDQLTQSWGARNLVGAIHLQFYWLITSGEDLTRCKYCNRIISYAPHLPSGDGVARKPRKDKEFCSTQCRQNYHYHNRIKPSRQNDH
jgi:hypothetical protein